MDLTDAEKAEIKRAIDRGEPLPDKYRFRLFREPRETELIWPGKTHEVTNVVLPFQSIEAYVVRSPQLGKINVKSQIAIAG